MTISDRDILWPNGVRLGWDSLVIGETINLTMKLKMGSNQSLAATDTVEIHMMWLPPEYWGSMAYDDNKLEQWITEYHLDYEGPTQLQTTIARGKSKTLTFEGITLTQQTRQQIEALSGASMGTNMHRFDFIVRVMSAAGARRMIEHVTGYSVFAQHFAPQCSPVTPIEDLHPKNPYGFFGSMVQNRSLPRLTFRYNQLDMYANTGEAVLTVRAPNGETEEYKATLMPVYQYSEAEQTIHIDLPEPKQSGIYSYTFKVTVDPYSNNPRSTSCTTGVSVLAYSPPTIAQYLPQRYKTVVNDDGSRSYLLADDGETIWITMDASISALAGKNAWTMRIQRDDTGQALNALSGSDGTRIMRTNDRSLDTRYYSAAQTIDVRVIIADYFETVEAVGTVYKAGGYMNVEKFGVGIGRRTSATPGDKRFEVAEDYRSFFYGGINGVNNYALGEVETGGHWIGGKPIYRYVIVCSVTGNGNRLLGTLPDKVDTLLRIEGSLRTGSSIYNLPYTSRGGDTYNAAPYLVPSDAGTELHLSIGSAITGNVDVMLILDYTKA